LLGLMVSDTFSGGAGTVERREGDENLEQTGCTILSIAIP